MRRIPIRMKLAAALAVPLVGLLVMTTFELASISHNVDRVRTQTALARVAVGPAGLITKLQNERSWPALELTGAENLIRVPIKDYAKTRQQTDAGVVQFKRELEALGPGAVAFYRDAVAGLGKLAQLRADIDADKTSPAHGTVDNNDFADKIYDRYTAIIRPFFDATDQVVLSIQDPQLRRGTELVNLSSRQIELFVDTARSEIVINSVRGGVTNLARVRAVVARKRAWLANIAEFERAEAPYDRIVAEKFPRKFVDSFSALVDRSLLGEPIPLEETVKPLNTKDSGGLVEFRMALTDQLTKTAEHRQHQAQGREQMFLMIGTVTLVAALVLTWLVSRSITGPLRSLTHQAKQLAEHRLPSAVDEVLRTPLGVDVVLPRVEPVTVDANDEVIEVAMALNRVQHTALDLALEQAVLRRNIADSFVNLGRRNQNLLRRQLDYITEFENRETDPDALANLFRLDHLATRMRRNAESLLVLAGTEPSRQWATPVNVNDVVRAALGEVEDYQRAMVRRLEPATIMGSATADLAHLIAELVENALVFSPDDRPVEIRGRRAADGGYVVAVMDSGRGMGPQEMEGANRRLAGAESFTVSPSKYLGHYVAGNLAARHRIRVRLMPGESNRGVTAVLEIPPDLLADTALDAPAGPVGPFGPFGQPAGLPAAPDRPAGPGGPAPTPPDAFAPLAPAGWMAQRS